MENVFTTFFDLSKKGQENSVNSVNCVKPLNYQTLPSKNETEEREGYYERTARPVGKSRITSTRPGLNQYKTPITKMLQRVAMIFAVLVMSVGQMWGATYTWDFTTHSKETISSGNTTTFTSTTGSKTLSYIAGSSCGWNDSPQYFKMGGATERNSSYALNDRYFTLVAPSSSGTISITYATSNFGAAMIRSGNGDYQVLSAGASNATRTTSVIYGLTANTTTINIGFKEKAYITSITWTDADAPTMTKLYESDLKASMSSGASIDAGGTTATETTGGSGWLASYSKYYKANGANNKTVTINFSPSLNLTSDGTDGGKVRLWYGTTSNTALDGSAVINNIKINGGTAIGAYSVLEKEKVHILEYTIDKAITSLSSFYANIAINGGCLLHIEVLTHSAASTWYVRGDWNSWGTTTNLTGDGTTLTATATLSANTDYEFLITDGETYYKNNGSVIGGNATTAAWATDKNYNSHLLTTEAGTYTFSFNTSSKVLAVTYPNSYKVYYKNTGSWGSVKAYKFTYKNPNTGENAAWASAPTVSTTEEICGDTYYYTMTDGYKTIIFYNGSNDSQKSGDMDAASGSGKYVSGTGNSWTAFPTYTVTYNKNGDGAGGAGSVTGSVPSDGSSPYTSGSTVTVLGKGDLSLDGYTFEGWNTVPGGGGTAYAKDETFSICENTTLYAQWELIPTYDVTYHANLDGASGSVSGLSDQDDGHIFNVADNGFSKSGYKFKWWNTAANGSGVDYYQGEPDTIKSADINLYAQWESVESNEEYWVGSPFTWTSSKITVGDMVITPESTSDVDLNGTLTANTSSTIVNKQSGLTRHAKVMALKNSDKYLQIHFSDGKPINKLYLGSTTNSTDNKKVVVVYSATSDFTTAGGAAHEFVTVGGTSNTVTLAGYNQATKAVTDVSPSLENTYYYARIYRKITSANTVFDNTANLGDGATMRIYSIKAKKGATCTAPSTVTVAPTTANGYRYTPGETISLTCTASGGSGGDYSYQWQKYNGSAWEDIDDATSAVYSKANCTTSDGGSYRCKVSTGEDCTTISDGGDGYKIRVWTFNGNYNDEGFIANNITWTGANTGTVTLTLNANSTYKFKVFDNDGKWFGCNSGITADVSNWTFRTNENNCSLTTGKVAGEYTFTIDITNVNDNNISVSVVYPKMRIYMVCGGTWCDADPAFFVHSWKGGTSHNVKMTAHTCESGLYYADIPSYDTDMTILRLKTGTESVVWEGDANFLNRSSNIIIGSNDKFTFSSWNTGVTPSQGTFTAGTYSPTTYTISFAGNGGIGSMSAIGSIACGADQAITANSFEKTGYNFSCWHADMDVTVGGATVTSGSAIANSATIQNITGNITLTAQWTPKTYTITASATVSNPMTADSKTGAITGSFTNNPVTEITSGTTTSTSSNTFTVNKGTPVTVTAAATIAGTAAQCDECTYVFDSWENIPATVTADVNTIHAVYKTTYTISFKETDESAVAGVSSTSYEYGVGKEASTLPTPSKSGYTFDGWYKENTLTNAATDIDNNDWGNVTYYAKWTEDASSYSVTYNGNDNTGGSVPSDATSYSAGDIVTVKGNTGSLVKTGQTFLGWSTSATASSGTFYPAGYKFEMPASNVTLYAVWGSAAEEKYYYGSITITTGALTPGSTGGHKGFFTNNGGEIATSSAISLSSTPGEAGYYYESSTLTHTALNKSSNWNASSSSKRTIRAFKFKSGDSYTLALGTKVATSIMFYGKCGSASKTMSVGEQEYESPSTKETFFSHEFTKSGNFTGNVTITQDGDFYGILVVTVSTGAGSNHTVSFNMNGHGSAIDAIANVPSDSKIGKPIPNPAAVDWEFGGWYKENTCTNEWNFASDVVNSDKTLYAKWTNCAPTITTQPVGNTYTRGATADPMTIVASGDVKGYQWFSNDENNATTGTPIDGQTTGGYRPTTGVVGTTYYYCVVSNDCGSVASDVVAIVVNDDRLTPCAAWTIDEPTHGGQGFSFSVAAKKNDCSEAWDGTLTEGMLTVSEGVILGAITVNNGTKTISGTYGVSGTAESPVTFYLSLPRTDTHSAALLSHTEDFTACAGGAGEVEIPVLSGTTDGGSVKDSPRYWWETAGNGRLFALSYGKSDCASTSDDNFSSDGFNYVTSSNTQRWVFQPYIEGVTKIRIYIKSATNGLTLSSIGGSNNWADQTSKYSSVTTSSITYGTTNATNFSNNEKGYIEITFGSALTANKYYMFAMSSSSTYIYGVKLYSTAAIDAGTITPTLAWSNSQANGATLEKREDDVDFAVTANRNDVNARASLGTISYSSSDPSVATVNATTGQVTIADNIDFGSAEYKTTTITATLAASGCYKRAQITYVLQVNKYVCTETVGTVSIQTDNGCEGKVLAVSGYEADATIQWYKDGVSLGASATSATYTANEGGTYYVVTTKTCDAVSNEITITFGTATATKIVDEWYVKNGRRTPDIALVQTENATGFTVKSGSTVIWNSDRTVTTGFGGCGFYLGTDGIIYLKGQQDDGTEPSGLTAGDETITITASACEAASGLDIVIHKQASTLKPSIAFVVDGGVGKAVNNVSPDKTSNRALWTYLTSAFDLTGCNIYWTTDEKALRQYYSQYDAILITDDPNTRQYPDGKDEKISATKGYVNAMGTLIDVRPMLTMEAYVSRLANWDCVKGTPYSPSPRDYVLKLQCKEHAIYKDLVENGTTVLHEEIDGIDHWYVTMVDASNKTYADTDDETDATGTPALQGFDGKVNAGMLGIGTIADETLQGGIERQAEPAARMMVLGINNKAMAALTDPGKKVIMNALKYLLNTDMETLEDCSNYFHGQGGTSTDWFTAANWSADKVPDPTVRAVILAPCEIAGATPARASSVDIAVGGKTGRYKSGASDCEGHLTIAATGALVVSEGVRRIEDAPNFGVDSRKPTQTSDLYIASTSDNGNGTLIFDNPDGNTQATVGYYSKATTDENETWNWQYMAVPFNDNSSAYRNFYDSYLYRWAENCSGWEVVPNRGAVYPWVGYTITQEGAKTYNMDGTLVETGEQTFTVPTGADLVLGNSWTAPLQIKQFEDDDFDGLVKNVYLFNTGYDPDGDHGDASERYEAGTYVVVPIHSSPYTGDSLISSLQAFTVTSEGGEGTLTLDYERHVRPARSTDKVNAGPMHAPRRAAAREDKPTVLKIWASGNRFDDRLVVLEREDFSTGSDDGWDGEKVLMGEMSPTIYTVMENGYESVTATNDYEGTLIGFKAGEDNEYTFRFEYDDDAEAVYLLDTELNIYTRILTGETYIFHCADKGEHNRFILTRKAPQITTGCEPIDGGGGPKATKFIKDNKLYILLNGVLYDATGKMMK